MNYKLIYPWLWKMAQKAVSGFAHGALVGGGVGAVKMQGRPILDPIMTAGVGGLFGAGKEVFLYVSSNPLPDLFAQPAQSTNETPK